MRPLRPFVAPRRARLRLHLRLRRTSRPSSEGEASAAPDNVANAVAPSGKVTGAYPSGFTSIETETSGAMMTLIREKEDLAFVKMSGENSDRETESGVEKSLKGRKLT